MGDRIGVLAPRRGVPFGGIEFRPGAAERLLLVGDETALPAVAGILRDLPRDARGTAFLEVPLAADAHDLGGPSGVEVVWLPRAGSPHGQLLRDAVLRHLGVARGPVGGPGAADDPVVDPDLWEIPSYSSSGEPLPDPGGASTDDLYAWIAGEAGVVTGLRRVLVRDLGMDRRQVALMGYWRRGVAMRS